MWHYTWEQNEVQFSKYGTNWHDIVISDFHVPTLLIHDTDDREIGIEHSKQICEMWSWAKLVTTNGLGHRKILNNDGVAKEMLHFIQTGQIRK